MNYGIVVLSLHELGTHLAIVIKRFVQLGWWIDQFGLQLSHDFGLSSLWLVCFNSNLGRCYSWVHIVRLRVIVRHTVWNWAWSCMIISCKFTILINRILLLHTIWLHRLHQAILLLIDLPICMMCSLSMWCKVEYVSSHFFRHIWIVGTIVLIAWGCSESWWISTSDIGGAINWGVHILRFTL